MITKVAILMLFALACESAPAPSYNHGSMEHQLIREQNKALKR